MSRRHAAASWDLEVGFGCIVRCRRVEPFPTDKVRGVILRYSGMNIPCMRPACSARRERQTRLSTRETTPVHYTNIKPVPGSRIFLDHYSIERQPLPFEYTWRRNGAYQPSVRTERTGDDAARH